MKNKDTGEVLFVVVFTLLRKEDVEKEEAEQKTVGKVSKATNQGARHEGEEDFEPEADDLD